MLALLERSDAHKQRIMMQRLAQDTGLDAALKRGTSRCTTNHQLCALTPIVPPPTRHIVCAAKSVMTVMAKFPLDALMSATTLEAVGGAVVAVFGHLTISRAPEYQHRWAQLVQAVSRDAVGKLVDILQVLVGHRCSLPQ